MMKGIESASAARIERMNATDDFRIALDVLPFAAALLSPDGLVVAHNAAFISPWGFRLSSVGPHTVGVILHGDDLPILAERISTLARRKQPVTTPLELRFLGAGNTVHTGLVALAPYDSVSSLLLMQIASLDEHVQREASLAALEERSRYALTASKLGVWDHDLKTGAFSFSDLWLQIRGFSTQDELIHNNANWIQQVHADDRAATLYAIDRQNQGDPDYAVFRYRVRHKDGHWIWIECRGMCVEWDADGNPARATGTDADVTSRKGWEDDMTAMSQRLKLALEVSRIGVFEADFTTGETTWDDRMYAIYNVPRDTVVRIGTIWESMLHPEDSERVLGKIAQHVATLEPFSDEYRVIRKDGSIGHMRSRAMLYVDSVTGHRMIVGANWDVSEDVELQRQLTQARDLAEARNTELEAARARIEHNALHDHLTGLPNRRFLDQVLDGDTDHRSLAILHIDLDRFKQINDTQGHGVGDIMLRHAAKTLSVCVRKEDFIARIGGDEFVVIAHTQSQRTLTDLAACIIAELRKPVTIEGNLCRIGASIGIASRAANSQSARQLLQNADIALYRAKNLGRNRYEVFSSGMQHEIVNAKKISDDILLALERHEFVPYFQFQFDARTLDLYGAETLARWQHPERGLLTPDRFLTIAEDLDAVATIDAQILEASLAEMRRFRTEGVHIPKISVNVSARRLHDPNLHRSVRQLGIEPGTVSFELLESIFLDDYNAVVAENLRNLRSQGIAIEIDDFGSGHASIVSLVRLAPSCLKIDRELIRPLPDSPEQRMLVRSIVEIGRSLNIRVIAEGVETAEHVRILRDIGCDALQGYALARPMPASAVVDFIRSERWRHGV